MHWQIFLISLALLQSSILAEGDVVVLNDKNFAEAIKNNQYVMVKFFAPWCGHCKEFAPEYEKAAKIFKEQGKSFVLADLDATENKETAEKYKIEGFPTVKLFINGTPIDYNGERTAEQVISFIERKSSPASAKLETKEDIAKIKDDKGLRCILGTNKENTLSFYTAIARTEEDYKFYHASPELLAEVFPEAREDNIVLLKDFDERMVVYSDKLEETKLKEFLTTNSLPLVSDMNLKVIQLIFAPGGKKGVFLFRDESASNAKEMDEELRKAAAELRSPDLIFSKADIKSEWGERVAEVFGVEDSHLPLLEVVELQQDIMRYKHTGELKADAIKQFINDWKAGKVERFMKSEPEPKDNNGPVYTVVGKTFKRDILDNDDDIMLMFYAPWCGHCKKFEPIYEDLAKSLGGNKKLKLMKMDGTKNDVKGHIIEGFPTIKFFPGKSKDQPIPYEGDRTAADVSKFIKEKASNPVDIPEFKAKDETDVGKEDL
eukprot:TRINITY_DN3795_c0_g1_i1.p1 TRINITY_DN3795_c0_g1~~TRINITY_DN3795_c0_g1_i1.p1  ORF type:complete len:489 (-),score=160.67 TRINITY_DN3795_c0_g1_i1:133-1599(-)